MLLCLFFNSNLFSLVGDYFVCVFISAIALTDKKVCKRG